MKKLSKIKYLGLLGYTMATLGAGSLLSGCSSILIKKQEPIPHSFAPSNVRVIPFQEYNPITSEEKIELEDKMLGTYVSKPYSLDELSLSILNPHTVRDIKDDPLRRVDINNYNKFEKDIILTAQELGYSKEDIRNLSINEAIMLSGKLVAHKLEYDHSMISEEDEEVFLEKDPLLLIYKLMEASLNKVETRNKRAIKIDNMPEDNIFSEGFGICRNYASVNSAVFEVLKDINPNLRNTYMRWYSPEEIGHSLSLPHAWNQVSTITRHDDDGLDILVTYVDPTWLDTRNRTISDTGKELKHVNDREIYAALDEAHFGADTLFAYNYLAQLYETLADNSRRFSLEFISSDENIEFYRKKAFEQRVKLCDKILDIVEKDPEKFEKINSLFKSSFQKSIEIMLRESSIEFFFKYGYNTIYPKDMNEFDESFRIYERTLRLVPEFVTEDNLTFDILEDYVENGKKYTRFVPNKISMQNLFNQVKSEYLNEGGSK